MAETRIDVGGVERISDVTVTASRPSRFGNALHRRALFAAWWSFGFCVVATVVWHIAFAKLVPITATRMPWIILFYVLGTCSVIGCFGILGFCIGLQIWRPDARTARGIAKPTDDQ